MTDTPNTSSIVRWNRAILSLFWAAVGMACLALLFIDQVRTTKLIVVPLGSSAVFLIVAWGFYRGARWARVAIGLLMALIALYCFDRLLAFSFRKAFNWMFLVFCLLLGVAFYTFLYLFSGLDRGGPVQSKSESDQSLLT